VDSLCPRCVRVSRIRSDVMWFGEMPRHMDAVLEALNVADLFVAVGTSGSVYAAAGFLAQAQAARIRTCEINLDPSDSARLFDEVRYGPASAAVPEWVEAVLTSGRASADGKKAER
jgi:NAD-dependent deacetylase